VRMPIDDSLTAEDKADGYILACQAEISGNVAVDA
jgi:ferredoxin